MAKAKTPTSKSPKKVPALKKPKTFVDISNEAKAAKKKSFVFKGITYEAMVNSKGLSYYGPKK
tara:strand:- start:4788 stop:4976 length:189 start_codon:yes stop_codon:yes gene_type:complete